MNKPNVIIPTAVLAVLAAAPGQATGTFDGAVIWGTPGSGGDHVERINHHKAQWEIP
jgi:hypothetical protein